MEIFKAKVFISLPLKDCQSLQLENLAFLFAEENHLRLNVAFSQLSLQLLNCSSLKLQHFRVR